LPLIKIIWKIGRFYFDIFKGRSLMPKFPVDAPKQRVVKSPEILGFKMIREREHISMERINTDGTKTLLT